MKTVLSLTAPNTSLEIVTNVRYEEHGIRVDQVTLRGDLVERFYPYTSVNYIETRKV